ncbi:MAG: putative selenate reductase subunit YgfK [Bacteroidetes bacterium]|jgi:putative selenate reductase|nr:putative selenate reductase subunit YgfK [Bacteroidota bacterium]MBT6685109.1 putative selenate reductase subunit YgfK [Bacteroidota bacterium]MBT7141926.1 putative selenate reductase subunit YgfK [Bacteroidota bacterium]MBT7491189.1 putative selenate reductase subunit YgfK [Bacteroidota bacterium]
MIFDFSKTDIFHTVSLKRLVQNIDRHFKEGNIFGIPKDLFYISKEKNALETNRCGQTLDNPVGVAAGPHSQLAQNIVSAWLCGARFIELKTIQTLDELDVSKPCIDMQDEGYNCEWSQELRIKQSFDEYLKAWILIHILNEKIGQGRSIGTIFNISVGYNLEGILNENVQWFLNKIENCSEDLAEMLDSIKNIYPEISEINIPSQISNNVTISTMHGCPPDEIEQIALYFVEKRKLHTTIKLNPTLVGKKELRSILNEKLKFQAVVPDSAFEHDLKYQDALKIISKVQESATKNNLKFSLKISNTLETKNNKTVFDKSQKMMYLSGRALHPISINLAKKLQNDFGGKLDLSFSAGIDAFNISEVIACGFSTITVCSDLLKPGGYMRLSQYFEEINSNFKKLKAENIKDFIQKKAQNIYQNNAQAVLENLKIYSKQVVEDERYKKDELVNYSIKSSKKLSYFDCIEAPCTNACSTLQDVPEYMFHSAKGNFQKAMDSILKTNPFPNVLGNICNHFCETKCTRINYDESLMIKEIKRFVAETGDKNTAILPETENKIRVAIIGAGPSGLACAYFLRLSGFEVHIFESYDSPGGMISDVIPKFRIDQKTILEDIDRIKLLGVKIHFNYKIGEKRFLEIRKKFKYVYIAIGAVNSQKLNIKGENPKTIIDSLSFLRKIKEVQNIELGKKLAIIGGGNTAIDCARTAKRFNDNKTEVTIIYRRTILEMPADHDEIRTAMKEGIKIIELCAPKSIFRNKNGEIKLICSRMKLSGKDKSGRPKPVEIKDSEAEFNFDTIIAAIGQKVDINFIKTDIFRKTGNLFETKLKNVLIGGDALRGASSVVDAVADGKNVANFIFEKEIQTNQKAFFKDNKKLTYNDLLVKKAKKIYPENSETNNNSLGFHSKISTKKQAKTEASRCLYCDELCDICVTVCPNRANYSYQSEPIKYNLDMVLIRENKLHIVADEEYVIDQKYQVLNIADWCNECGNCTTFCPTKGQPFKDKPKFHLSKKSFEASNLGFFYHISEYGKSLMFKNGNDRHIFAIENEKFIYITPHFQMMLNPDDFKIEDISFFAKKPDKIKLQIAAQMSILYKACENLYEFEKKKYDF